MIHANSSLTNSTPPLVFFIGIAVIIALLIAYTILEIARPWPEKQRIKQREKDRIAREQRHAAQDALLQDAIQKDAEVTAQYSHIPTAHEIIQSVNQTDSPQPSQDINTEVVEPVDNDIPTTDEMSFETLPAERTAIPKPIVPESTNTLEPDA